MNRSYSKIRHIQESNQRLEKRLLNEQSQSGNPEEDKIIEYVKTKWGIPENSDDLEQNSAFLSILNKDGSSIKFNFQKGVIEFDKNWAIDPTPIPIKSNFNDFKKWFDSNNNKNPVSSIMN